MDLAGAINESGQGTLAYRLPPSLATSALDDAHKASGPVQRKANVTPPNCTDKSKVECFVAVVHRIDVCVHAIGGKGWREVTLGQQRSPIYSLATG